MAVTLRQGGGAKIMEKIIFIEALFSDGHVPTAIKLEGAGGGGC